MLMGVPFIIYYILFITFSHTKKVKQINRCLRKCYTQNVDSYIYHNYIFNYTKKYQKKLIIHVRNNQSLCLILEKISL